MYHGTGSYERKEKIPCPGYNCMINTSNVSESESVGMGVEL